MRIPIHLAAILLALQFTAAAQNTILFQGEKGETLLTSIVNNYKTSSVLEYNQARDALWGAIARYHNGQLSGVYTGYTISIDTNGSNPRTEAYQKGIDCEHTWPQSMGASNGKAKSDMHHLFPTKQEANSTRGSYPFAEIEDSKTDKWFKDDQILTSKPSSDIDAYSEFDDKGYFEPRESHKGNVARAMFYFYAMYQSEADDNFFLQQKNTLYKWHVQDPVDAEEIWRNNFIATKQSNKKNPFILDSSLIRRAFFPHLVSDITFTVLPSSHTIFSGADSLVEFSVNTNLDSWTTETDRDWLTITSDYTNKIVKVSIGKNTSEQRRQAFISIKGEGAPEQIVSVDQAVYSETTPIEISEKLDEIFKIFPNPFDHKISFVFNISEPSHVQIMIFDSKGQIVKTHFNFYPEKGQYVIDFETGELESGYYYYNFILNNAEKKGELILAR